MKDLLFFKIHLSILSGYNLSKKSHFLFFFSKVIEIIIKILVLLQNKFSKWQFPSRVTGGWRWKWFWRWEIINKWYEYSTVQECKKLIFPGMKVMDIGAHIGYFSILFSEIVGSKGKVFAFEPCPENYSLLINNISNAKNNVIEVFNYALSDKQGMTELYLSKGNSMHSLIKEYSGGNFGTSVVRTRTIDDFLESINNPQIDFIKIDVEGSELKVLEGMINTIRKNRNLKILIELNPKALFAANSSGEILINTLKTLGFSLKEIKDSGKIVSPELTVDKVVNLICFPNLSL